MCWSCMKIWRFGNVPQGLLSSWSNLKAIDKTSKLQKRRIDAWVRTHLAPSGFPDDLISLQCAKRGTRGLGATSNPGENLASPLSYRSTRFDDGLFRRHVAPLLLPWHQFFVFYEARLLAECHGAADTAQKHSKKTSGQLENGPSASEIKSWHDSGTFGKAQLQKGDGRFTWRQFSKRENSQIAFHRWSPNVPKCQWAPTNSTRCHLTACHSTSPAEREMNQRHVLFHHRRRGVSGPI